MEEQQEQVTHSVTSLNLPDAANRIRAIRARLPGQMLWERIDTARAAYAVIARWD